MKRVLLISICSILLYGCTSDRLAIYCRFIERHKYDDVINNATRIARLEQDNNEQAKYWLLSGIAHQLKGQLEQSLSCYNESLFYDNNYNYLAYEYKAQVLKSKNDYKNEKTNLVLALKCINNLIALNNSSKKSFWKMFDDSNPYSTFDFSVGYHVEKISIEDQHKSFETRLQKRKDKISELISTCNSALVRSGD